MPTTTLTYAQEWAKRLTLALLLKQLADGVARITQGEIAAGVAKALGHVPTRQTVSLWVRGETAPDSETQIALAEWLGVDPGWFVAGERSAAPAPETPARTLSLDITKAARSRGQANRAAKNAQHPKVGNHRGRNAR